MQGKVQNLKNNIIGALVTRAPLLLFRVVLMLAKVQKQLLRETRLFLLNVRKKMVLYITEKVKQYMFCLKNGKFPLILDMDIFRYM